MGKWFFTLESRYSKFSSTGYGRFRLDWRSSEEIINLARIELRKGETSLEDIAGIPCLGLNLDEPSRDWRDGEELETAIKSLSSDGYLFEAYSDSDVADVSKFLKRVQKVARYWSLVHNARHLVVDVLRRDRDYRKN